MSIQNSKRQPPCEAVSWNSHSHTVLSVRSCQPPCEAVSWNKLRYDEILTSVGQPPCEAVSWNTIIRGMSNISLPSASLWGCELKFFYPDIPFSLFCQPPCEAVSWNTTHLHTTLSSYVSLLVRLWVEISSFPQKHPHLTVSLLVRLWVEILMRAWNMRCSESQPPCEAVSWNMTDPPVADPVACQPPCEAVSWNFGWLHDEEFLPRVSLLVRLWVEMTNEPRTNYEKYVSLLECWDAFLAML